jgi:hypothetical protein
LVSDVISFFVWLLSFFFEMGGLGFVFENLKKSRYRVRNISEMINASLLTAAGLQNEMLLLLSRPAQEAARAGGCSTVK